MQNKEAKALVLFSGGIDSAASTYFLKNQGYDVSGFFVNYGHAANVYEMRSAKGMADFLKVPLQLCTVLGESTFREGEILGRNAFLVFTALMFSNVKCGLICLGIHSGTPYYDCSSRFFELLSQLVQEHSDGRLKLVAPFLNWNKKEIITYFLDQGLPVDLTYSCEKGNISPCGVCASCRDRNAYVSGR